MNQVKNNLTLDCLTTYQIKVPGEIGASLGEWGKELIVISEKHSPGSSVTTLTGDFDQAALYGFLRHLYSIGLPLISVICVDHL